MAKIHFSLECLNGTPNAGEAKVLDFLKRNLDDNYEIYFKPNFNIDTPDIVLIRKGGGVVLINVCNTSVLNNRSKKHPTVRLKNYKENLINLHIPNLLQYTYRSVNYKSIVSCLLFIYCDDNDAKFSFNNYSADVDVFTESNLNKEKFDLFLERRKISVDNTRFKNEFYKCLKDYLEPKFHSMNEGKEVNFTKRQQELIISKQGDQKIKGIVGSGKTLVLTHRAINAHKRTNDKVLILTYNYALKDYVRSKISDVKEDFYWYNFDIANFHDFINSVINNLSVKVNISTDFKELNSIDKKNVIEDLYYGNKSVLRDFVSEIKKYTTILIDEVQDYQTSWLRLIKECFLTENGEFVVFGDSKQDIYNRVDFINNKKELVIPESVGRWNELNKSFRLTPTITAFASAFQQHLLASKHNVDFFEHSNFQASMFDKVHYKFFGQLNYEQIAEFIHSYLIITKANLNDTCVLSTSVEIIRNIDFCYRMRSKNKSYIMAETEEVFQKFKSNNEKLYDLELKKIRKNKKNNFKVNSGSIKFSTIHSYKGWEAKTLFLIVNHYESMKEVYQELIYTGFTRCSNNLVILNINDNILDDFVKELEYVEHV